MGVLAILIIAAVFLILGGVFYAPLIARILGERTDRPTPATQINDGRDYVPTRTPVVFAHHYASIAGAGPIIGPIIAIYYGWLPALLWVLLGGVFLGAVHDYAATHVSMREGGKNLAIVARRYIGVGAFAMMLVMLVALLVLVCAAFLDLSATALTSKISVDVLQLPREQTLLRSEQASIMTPPATELPTLAAAAEIPEAWRDQFAAAGKKLTEAAALSVVEPGAQWKITDAAHAYDIHLQTQQDGQAFYSVSETEAVLGGIASTSVVVITLFSPLIGFLYLKRKTPVWICSLLAIIICGLSITIGLWLPMPVSPQTWKALISGYVLISAGVPVWLFLQSRDFINVHILYVGMAFVIVAVIAAAIRGGGQFALTDTAIPASNWANASAKLGPGWPVLFVVIACGAVSGFHSLCAGGTTCKQLRTEVAARHVGYYAMLLESFLAVCVICCLVVGLSLAGYQVLCHPNVGKGNAILTFAMAVGRTAHAGLGLPVAYGALGAMLLLEGFLVTTLDTAIRLTRYMIEEGWATFFGRYDVFATEAARLQQETQADRGTTELTGTGGLSIERPNMQDGPRGGIIKRMACSAPHSHCSNTTGSIPAWRCS